MPTVLPETSLPSTEQSRLFSTSTPSSFWRATLPVMRTWSLWPGEQSVRRVAVGAVTADREPVDAREVYAILCESPHGEAADREAPQRRAVQPTRRVLGIGLGHGAGGVGRAHPDPEALSARVLEHDWPPYSRSADEADAIEGDGQGVELARGALMVDPGHHFDCVARSGARERGADRLAGADHERRRERGKGRGQQAESGEGGVGDQPGGGDGPAGVLLDAHGRFSFTLEVADYRGWEVARVNERGRLSMHRIPPPR